MAVLDLGCGPGFFIIEMAQMVGMSGNVIACDLPEGMLQKLEAKIRGSNVEQRTTLHKSDKHRMGVNEQIDFALLFYVVHEVPNKDALFAELRTILKPGGQALLVEPPFHVSRSESILRTARAVGLAILERPRMFPNKAAVLGKV